MFNLFQIKAFTPHLNYYDAGHMTKMTAMPIYGKNPSKLLYLTSF